MRVLGSCFLISLSALLLLAPESWAGEFTHQINLTVTGKGQNPDSLEPLPPVFGDVVAGDRFTAFLDVPDGTTATDGRHAATLDAFLLQIGGAIWDSTNPAGGSDFVEFRGLTGLGSDWGFDVSGGQIINVLGGVTGPGDVRYIDFSFPGVPDNQFFATDGKYLLYGTFTVSEVPEPATCLLVGLGVAAFPLTRRRRKQRTG